MINFFSETNKVKIRYFIFLDGKLTHNGYNTKEKALAPVPPPCEFMIRIEYEYQNEWKKLYSHSEDKIEILSNIIDGILSTFGFFGMNYLYSVQLQEIMQKEQAEYQAAQKRLFEDNQKAIAEKAKADDDLWYSQPMYKRVYDRLSGKVMSRKPLTRKFK
jgi:hypothetical protein